MKSILVLAGAVCLVTAGLFITPAARAQSEPAAVVQAFIQAFNTYDAATSTALVTEDFELKIVYGGPDDPVISGKEGLTGMLEGVKQDSFQLSVANLKAEGERVTGNYTGDGDQIRAVGIGPEIGTIEAVVQNGLLKTLAFTVDPEYNKRSEEAIAAQEKLPQTGGEVTTLPVMLGVAGLALLGLGGWLWRRTQVRA